MSDPIAHARPTATIVECEDEICPTLGLPYSPGWGYRIDATGDIVNGDGEGERVWQEDDAASAAMAEGFGIANPWPGIECALPELPPGFFS